MDKETQERFQAALERKKEEARKRSLQQPPTGTAPADEPGAITGDQHSIISDERKSQDVFSVREKSSGKGHKTADKWNQ